MENLNDIFNQYVESGKYPGIQWKIIQNNSINAGLVGYKNLEKKEILLPDTIYRIWSMTKPVVAIAAMQLVESGVLNLEDSIDYYLPEFSNIKVLKRLDSKITDVVSLEKQTTIINSLENIWMQQNR